MERFLQHLPAADSLFPSSAADSLLNARPQLRPRSLRCSTGLGAEAAAAAPRTPRELAS